MKFEWDANKERANLAKHGIDFATASEVFDDPDRIVRPDEKHGGDEQRFLCYGRVDGRVLTVRFVMREDIIRIFGAGEWRIGRKIYEENN